VGSKFIIFGFRNGERKLERGRLNKDASLVETPFVHSIVALQASGGMDSNEEVGNLLGTPVVQAILDICILSTAKFLNKIYK